MMGSSATAAREFVVSAAAVFQLLDLRRVQGQGHVAGNGLVASPRVGLLVRIPRRMGSARGPCRYAWGRLGVLSVMHGVPI